MNRIGTIIFLSMLAMGTAHAVLETEEEEDPCSSPFGSPRLTQTCLAGSGNPGHASSKVVHQALQPSDQGGWLYVNDPLSVDFGTIRPNCTHPDLSGNPWASWTGKTIELSPLE